MALGLVSPAPPSYLAAMARSAEEVYEIWPRVQHLCQAVVRLTSMHELSPVLQEIVDSARTVIGARYAALGVLDTVGTSLTTFTTSGLTPEEREAIGTLPVGKGILGLLIKDPRPLRLAHLGSHPAAAGFPPHHPPMESFLGVPITGRHGPIGNLYLTEKEGAPEFSEQDEAIAVMLAAHAAVAVENARRHGEREELLSKLKAMQASRDRFFSMINHELRNAVTAVFGWSELWMRKMGKDAPRPAVEVFESAQRTVNLLDDLLDLNRLDAAKLKLMVHETDLRAIVEEAVASLEPRAMSEGTKIKIVGQDGPLPCRTDPKRVMQILVNLLTNAVRHSPEGKPVSVELHPDSDHVRIDVVDRGEGIAPELHATIFEAFERGANESERGTGLGLTLSRNLALLLGGNLQVESQPGRGARFILELPRHVSQNED